MAICKRWAGRVYGTNTGDLFVKFDGEDDALSGTLHLNDPRYGLVVYNIEASFNGTELALAGEPEETEKDGIQYGKLTATAKLRSNGDMEGDWTTDQGSAGTFLLFPHNRDDYNVANANIPRQLHTGRYNLNSIEIDRKQIIELAENIKSDLKGSEVVITFVGETEQSIYLEEFKNCNINSNKTSIIKIVATVPEGGGINRVVSIHFGPDFNELMTQSSDESWALGKLEVLKRDLRRFENVYTTNIKTLMGYGVNQLLLAWVIIFMPSIEYLWQRIAFMAIILSLIWAVNRLHSKYLPHALIYLTERPAGLFNFIGPTLGSWLIGASASLVAALASAYLQGWLNLTSSP